MNTEEGDKLKDSGNGTGTSYSFLEHYFQMPE